MFALYSNVTQHRSMVLDDVRNSTYYAALKQLITPESVVLDLGAGMGLHGLMAAQLGAKHVYLVEPKDIIGLAKRVAIANGLADRMTFLQGRIESVPLPEPVDLIVSVLTGNFLLQEDLLPSLVYARNHYLKEGGHLVPDVGRMIVAPVCAPEVFGRTVARWSEPIQGFDFSPVRKIAANLLTFKHFNEAQPQFLAPSQTILSLDLSSTNDPACHQTTAFTFDVEGVCHGFIGWFEMKLGETWLSTGPMAPKLHWRQVFLPIDPPLTVAVGEQMSLRIDRPAFKDWTWRVAHNGTRQAHSTFLTSTPLEKRLPQMESRPRLTPHGQLVQAILPHLNGDHSIDQIVMLVQAQAPDLVSSKAELLQLVRTVTTQFAAT